jgi:hypothetical protein
LICWEHLQLASITVAMGVTQYANESGWKGVIEYPNERFDLIWVIPTPYTEIARVEGEQVPVLDDGKTPDQDSSGRQSREVTLALLSFVSVHIIYSLLISLN